MGAKKKVHKRKKIQIEYEYLPQDYKDPATVICTKPTKPSKGSDFILYQSFQVYYSKTHILHWTSIKTTIRPRLGTSQ